MQNTFKELYIMKIWDDRKTASSISEIIEIPNFVIYLYRSLYHDVKAGSRLIIHIIDAGPPK